MTKYILATLDEPLAIAWREAFADISEDQVEVLLGSIFSRQAEAIVSPANSFGFMDGGLDAQLTDILGPHVQRNLQEAISSIHNGELLVGQCHAISTGHKSWPKLISAPTMRVPMILPSDTINPYLASRAIFNMAEALRFKTVLIPGLGTGVGGVSPQLCAHQMRSAYDQVYIAKQFPLSWRTAQIAHQKLFSTTIRDLQYK